ncbi:MAG: hypothetical protein IPJ65_12490 [Archangiaceae bacterium]|nr:hypothetical protein [Archangiaceae bacterium]
MRTFLLLIAVLLAGCPSPGGDDAGSGLGSPSDSGANPDAGAADAGSTPDAGSDDAGSMSPDAGVDGGSDVDGGYDGGTLFPDAGHDAGVTDDGGYDAGLTTSDAGRDGGSSSGTDGGRDGGSSGGADGGRDGGSSGGADGGRDGGSSGGTDAGRDAGVSADAGPECRAQRAVYIVNGNGGLAWYTQLWPAPAVIAGYQSTYAYDDPANATQLQAGGHPLYARRIGSGALWLKAGTRVEPSVFIAGTNQTHTNAPQLPRVDGGNIMALAAAAQTSLGSPVPVLTAGCQGCYTNGPGEPSQVAVGPGDLIDATVAAIRTRTTLSAATEAKLRPTAAQIQGWTGPNPTAQSTALATRLWLAANAFKLGLVSTMVIGGYADDPHTAFAAGANPARTTDELAGILDAFTRELAAHPEPTCSHRGAALTLDHNVAVVISGDTPKSPFVANGWPDGSPSGSNLVYVRSNGFLGAGWFGQLSPTGRTLFDPISGALSTTAPRSASDEAAMLGILFAISRGDTARVVSVSPAPYLGVVSSQLP